jgi:hypothetical protein
MCLAWKILKTLDHDVDRKGIPPKILFIFDSSFELWHLCKSMLPSAKGLSIYFYVILLLFVESSPSQINTSSESTIVILMHCE